jgi:DNA-binding NarL/FixJ family response regulator
MIDTTRKVRAAIVDQHEVVRVGVRAALASDGRIEIVAEGKTATEALQLANEHHPDVLLLGLNAITGQSVTNSALFACELIRHLVTSCQTRILVISRHTHKALVRMALSAGASGFMSKDEAMNSCTVLAQAIVEIARWKKLPLSPALYEKLYQHDLEMGDVPQLTPRRIEIMQTIADNPQLTLAQVAGLLGIAESTLRNNLSAIFRALDTPNINGAMVECLRLGLVQINP